MKKVHNHSHNADVTSSNLVVATKKQKKTAPYEGLFRFWRCGFSDVVSPAPSRLPFFSLLPFWPCRLAVRWHSCPAQLQPTAPRPPAHRCPAYLAPHQRGANLTCSWLVRVPTPGLNLAISSCRWLKTSHRRRALRMVFRWVCIKFVHTTSQTEHPGSAQQSRASAVPHACCLTDPPALVSLPSRVALDSQGTRRVAYVSPRGPYRRAFATRPRPRQRCLPMGAGTFTRGCRTSGSMSCWKVTGLP